MRGWLGMRGEWWIQAVFCSEMGLWWGCGVIVLLCYGQRSGQLFDMACKLCLGPQVYGRQSGRYR